GKSFCLSAAEKRDYEVVFESRQLLFYAFLKFFISAFLTSRLGKSFKNSSKPSASRLHIGSSFVSLLCVASAGGEL
ncbi:hypothetical protein, partial [Herbaspirillum robiniae]|uniref:hypothetical protein n=1 Tax=Herbaspirillum robiniae TaxID=2014887 RepID=UPI001A9CB122